MPVQLHRESTGGEERIRHDVDACVHVFPGMRAEQPKSLKGGEGRRREREGGRESEEANEQQRWMQKRF